ncbi:MAG: type III pantothenate kinase [Flavobacteriaceae bacterium]
MQKEKESGGDLPYLRVHCTVDIGNTRIKVGLFDAQGQGVAYATFGAERFISEFAVWVGHYSEVSEVVVSSVAGVLDASYWGQVFPQAGLWFMEGLVMPFESAYGPGLGADRKAVLAAAWSLYPKRNCLVVDAGSCVTYDLLSAEGTHLGGGIAPGLQMRLDAMHQGTARLPKLTFEAADSLLGLDTQSCMSTGAASGMVFEIEGWYEALSAQYGDLTLILTGGDAEFLSVRVKKAIFAEPYFLLQGLNALLEYQKSL